MAQTDGTYCQRNTEGADFWFGFMEGRNLKNVHFLEINVSAREATTFKITYGPDEIQLGGLYHVYPENSTKVRIPWEQFEHFGSEKTEDKGIHLVSEKPVNVYALNWDQNSNDVAVIYPTGSLGYEYYAMCYSPSEKPGENGKNTEFLIVATEDQTIVSITPSVYTDQGRQAGLPFEITLGKGQSYQVQSMNRYDKKQGDLTGSYITSDKPIAVFSGSLVAIIPRGANSGTGDHLFEQLPPVHAWGREFFTVPFRFRERDRLRILAKEDNTIVWINGISPDTLNKGEFRDTILLWYQPKRIIAEKPILVAHYSQSASEDRGNFSGGNFEPFMIILPPAAQFRNNANFIVYKSEQYSDYFINVIFPASELSNIYLNNKRFTELEQSDPYSYDIFRPEKGFGGNYFARFKLGPGVYNISISTPGKGFYAYSYSFGMQESFGYGISFNLNNLLDLRSSISFKEDTLLLCYGDTLLLDAGQWFNEFEWSTGENTQIIPVADSGLYWATVKDANGCLQTDSVYVFMSHPVTNLGKDIEGCEPLSLKLDAGGGFKKYSWSTGEQTREITADKTGAYKVTVQNSYGCKASDEIGLTVYPIPKIEVISNTNICDTMVAEVEVKISRTNLQPWDMPLTCNWRVENTNIAINNTSDTTTTVTVNDWGNYHIYYDALTKDGCDTTITIELSFDQTPVSKFIIDGENDECSNFSREVIFTGESYSNNLNFNWDFGNSLAVETLAWQHYRVSLGIEANPVISLIVERNGCVSRQFSKSLDVLPNFNIETSDNKGCDSLLVTFNTPPINDTEYYWDFGDGSRGTGHNTAHNYSYPGKYDVGLKISSQTNNCKAAYIFNEMIKVFPTPTASFTGDQNHCYDDSISLKYLNYNDSSITRWFVNEALLPDTIMAPEITVKLQNQYTRVILEVVEHGCVSTKSFKRFSRKPHVDFKLDKNEGCQPLVVHATGASTDNNINYYWSVDRQVKGLFNSIYYKFNKPGYHDIGLRAYSTQTGCDNVTSRNDAVYVHPSPTARFNADKQAAYHDNSLISFNNLSELGFDYFWDFGDGNTSQQKNPKHEYGVVGVFEPTLIAETEYGCTDTASMEITIMPLNFFAPNAFRPDSNIPENKFFMPVGDKAGPGKINLKIYNRWGRLVFESDNILDKWDGKTLDGENAQMGNYIWTVSYHDLLGTIREAKGQVLLVR